MLVDMGEGLAAEKDVAVAAGPVGAEKSARLEAPITTQIGSEARSDHEYLRGADIVESQLVGRHIDCVTGHRMETALLVAEIRGKGEVGYARWMPDHEMRMP